MERIGLKAHVREQTGKGIARRCRVKGLIPGIFYGSAIEPIPLTIAQAELKKVLKGKGGENVIIDLTLEGKEAFGSQTAMIQDLQIDTIKRDIIHIDLHKIDLEKKVEVAVPIELTGKAEGVKLGGILQQIERDLEIRCMPLQIPDRIEVDISHLGIGDSIHIRDIAAPEGSEILSSGEQTIATIVSPKAEVAVEVEEEKEEEAAEGAPAAEKEEKAKEKEAEA